MIVDERITSYIHSLDQGNTQLLTQIEREASADLVPIIRQETASFLKVLLRMQRPKNILEVGTAVGFSALFMSEYAPADCRITTIEKYEKRIPIARENFRRAGKEDVITLLEGDGSISISCRMCCGFWLRAACCCLTTCSRTGTSSSPGLRWSGGTGRSTAGCGSICMR